MRSDTAKIDDNTTSCHRLRINQSRQRGVAAVELAVTLLLILTIMFVILDGARLIFAYSTVSNAAREGVRFGAVRGVEAGSDVNRPEGDAPATAGQITDYLEDFAFVPVRVTVVWPPLGAGGAVTKRAGAVLEVTVESDFNPAVPFLDPITVSSTSRMVIFY